MKKPPATLFKYTSAAAARQILSRSTVRWTAPSHFNDPFDMQLEPYMSETIDEVRRQIKELAETQWELLTHPLYYHGIGPRLEGPGYLAFTRLQLDVRRFAESHRVFCVSERLDSLHMWSHYADGHSGAVLEFSTDYSDSCMLCNARPVKYVTRMSPLLTRKEWMMFLLEGAPVNWERIVKILLATKHRQWAYEKEWRSFRMLHDDTNSRFVEIPFSGGELKAVYLGYRMREEHRNEIKDIVWSQFPATQLIQEKLTRSTSSC